MQRINRRVGQFTVRIRCQPLRHYSEKPLTAASDSPTVNTPDTDSSVSKLRPRIVSTWGTINIPSREAVLKNPHVRNTFIPFADPSRSFQPSLAYLTEATSKSSFAQKLAQAKANASAPSPQELSPTKPRWRKQQQLLPNTHKGAGDRKRQGQTRQQKGLAPQQNIPEKRLEGAQNLLINRVPQRDPAARELVTRRNADKRSASLRFSGVEAASQAQAQALSRLRTTPARQVGRQDESSSWTRSRTQDNAVAMKRKAVRKGMVAVPKPKPVIDCDTLEQAEDDGLEGDPFTPPQMPGRTDVDVRMINWDEVFTSLQPLLPYPKQLQPLFWNESRLQWVEENLGGDYTRYAPLESSQFLAGHKLGPVQHSQLALSHTPGIPLPQREAVTKIVEASVRT